MAAKNSVEARKLKGFRDYLPQSAGLRQHIIDAVRHEAGLHGFAPIDTPAIEYQDVLLGSGGQETDKEVYRFADHGDRDVALRFDLTVPFARFVTENYSELSFPFKKLQIGEVWRGEKPQKGRYRQFCQADIDIIGADSLLADVEIIQCVAAALNKLINTPFTISINSRQILSGVIASTIGSITAEQEQQILIAIDKLEKIGEAKVINLLAEHGINENQSTKLLEVLSTPDEKTWQRLGDLFKSDSMLTAELNRFKTTVERLRSLAPNENCNIKANLSIARGLGYYTGIVYETTIDELPKFGSVSSGGRYNNLVARFGKHDLEGVGGSIGVDRLLAALEELGQAENKSIIDAFIAIANPEANPEVDAFAQQVAHDLRTNGLRVDLAVRTKKLPAQFKLADKLKAPFVLTIGADEAAQKTCSLKNLATGEQKRGISLEEAIVILNKNT